MFFFFHDSYGHNATRAAILTAFRALLRKSQITNSDSVLLRSDFAFFSWGMIITIRKSKTIQFSERKLLIPVSRLKNTSLCAVFWTEKHFSEVQANDSSPAFLVPTRRGNSAIPYQKLQSTIKIVAAKAGFDQSVFSCHSLRRGGATFLHLQGASIEQIKTRGDWRSDCVYKYIQIPLSQRILDDMKSSTAIDEICSNY